MNRQPQESDGPFPTERIDWGEVAWEREINERRRTRRFAKRPYKLPWHLSVPKEHDDE